MFVCSFPGGLLVSFSAGPSCLLYIGTSERGICHGAGKNTAGKGVEARSRGKEAEGEGGGRSGALWVRGAHPGAIAAKKSLQSGAEWCNRVRFGARGAAAAECLGRGQAFLEAEAEPDAVTRRYSCGRDDRWQAASIG